MRLRASDLRLRFRPGAGSLDPGAGYTNTLTATLPNGTTGAYYLLVDTDSSNAVFELDKANKNGIWARIIKNGFAPLFIGQVDYVAGNPPWVVWDNLPV